MSAVIARLEADRIAAVKECDALRAEVERLKSERIEREAMLAAVKMQRDEHRAEVARLTTERDFAENQERLRADCEARMALRVAEVEFEVEALRGLIRDAEWASGGYIMGDPRCPWCEALTGKSHLIDCPAFSAQGEVRR